MDPLVITTAFCLGYLAYRIGLPPLVGFLLAGFGLHMYGYTSSPGLETLSEMGVTLLLFTIGLKLNVRSLLKPEVLGCTTIHMSLSVIVVGFSLFLFSQAGLQFFLGIDLSTAMLVAFGLSFSSTVFAVKVLEESGRMDSLNGRVAIGVLVIQDIVAVVYLTFSTGKIPTYWAILLIALLPVARKVFMLIMDRVGHGELQILFGMFLALCAGAATFSMVGLKPDLGALILGMLVAPHSRSKEIAKSLMGIKDFMLIGFFISIGLNGLPGSAGFAAAVILVLLLPFKMLLYFFLFTRFKLKAKTSFETTMSLTNYSEFGLIVCSMAVASGNLDKQWLVVMAIAFSLSLVLISLLNGYGEVIYDRLQLVLKKFETKDHHPEEQPYEIGKWEIAIFGMGRIGTGAYDVFQKKFGDVVIGIDYDPVTLEEQKNEGREVIQGDVTDPDFWMRLPEVKTPLKLIILTMPSLDEKLYIAKMLKKRRFGGVVAAVAQFDDEVQALQEAGIKTAFNIYSEAGAGLAGHVCEQIQGGENFF